MSIKIENVVLPSNVQWKAVIRGMRNPKNSWDRMDSDFYARRDLFYRDNDIMACYDEDGNPYVLDKVELGPNDLKLMNQLAKGGPVHAKYRRMIPVYLDITRPLYWWKEMDTYKIGVTANSCSTMHKIHAKAFEWDDFSHEHLNLDSMEMLEKIIKVLNAYREDYISTKDKDAWWQLIQMLPSSYNQKRTVMLNYEVLVNIYNSRRGHKLDEWHDFCKWIESLPYSELITGKES